MEYNIERELEQHGECLFQTVGDSMEPVLHNRKSSVLIKKTDGCLAKYDVALYRRPSGQYVLHRIIEVCEDSYHICGDNRIWVETVPKEWVLGRMAGFYPDESAQFVDCAADEDYLDYVAHWEQRFRSRKLKALPKRAIRKLKRVITGQNA